jgi:HEAT repeat protein
MTLVGRLQAEQQIAALRAHPKASDPRRIEARVKLLALGAEAVEPLVASLQPLETRAAVTEILECLLTDATLPSYMAALGASDPVVTATVSGILARGRNYDPTPLLDLFADPAVPSARLETILSAQMARIQPRLLVDLIPDLSRDARAVTFRLLDRHADANAVLDSVRLTEDADWWIRQQMARLLARVPHPTGVDALVRLLGDENRGVRLDAARSLGERRDRRAIPALVAALRDADLRVQTAAIDALVSLGDEAAVPLLLDLLDEESESARRGAVEALNELATPEAADALARLLDSDDWWLRDRAADALVKLGDPRGAIHRPGRGATSSAAVAPRGAAAPPATFATPQPTSASLPPLDAAPPPRSAPRPVVRDFTTLDPGELLAERYRVVRTIGGGGFGTVYLVRDLLIDEEIVLKILNPHLTHDRTMMTRFAQELRVTRRISHSGVIRTHELVDLGGGHAIAMEYFASEDLARLLKRCGPVAPERIVGIAAQAAEALAAAHELDIVHRDVKPGNILVGADDVVKLVDFGLATAAGTDRSRLTRSGHFLGTPEYMAPEQITDGTIDARSDIYSLGVVLYEALSGVSPFAGENPAHVLFRHIEGDAPALEDAAPGTPRALAELIQAAMARHPADRPATAVELALRFRRLGERRVAGEEAA